RDFYDPDSPVIGAEFITTSISSKGDGQDETQWGQTILGECPHLKFHNDQRGYISCLVTPEEGFADYRVAERASTNTGTVTSRAHQRRAVRHRSRRPGGASSMSKRRHLLTAAGTGALTTMLLATSTAQGVGPGPSRAPILLDADPSAVTIAPLPCDRRGEVALSMTNTGSEGEFVDAVLTASPGLELSRELWSTYLPPADPAQAVSAHVTVTAAEATAPGEYELQMAAAEQTLSIPVTIEGPPGDGPDANLALYRQAFASTTHPNTTLCGAVDGNRDSEQW